MKTTRSARIVLSIVTQFKELRLAQDMSHDDLAKKSGVTRPAISHIESGRRKPSLTMSLRLADALGHNLSDIIRDAEKREKDIKK